MITAELDTSTIEITNSIDNVVLDNNNITAGYDNSYNVDIEDLSDLDITVAKKEYTIVGDDIYIPQLYDDAPQWMKDLVELVVDISMTTNSTKLINDMNAMLQEFAVSYVPLNQYTQSILDLGNEDMRLNALIETLNSNFNNGLSNANAQIINLQMTKASKDEVVAQVIQTLAAELANPNSNLGATVVRLDQAIVSEQAARATSFRALTASMESINGEIAAKAEILENALAYVGIDEAGASTNTGLSAYLEASDGTIGGADSKVANDIRVTAEGVESKWAYNSTVNVNGVYRKSGFGLTANNFSGAGTQANPYTSEFWIDATKLRFTNSANTGRTAPFTIDATGTTPQIKFNGVVEFSNVNGASQGVVNEVNNGQTTTINGGRITTGSVTANQIAAKTITANQIAANSVTADVLQAGVSGSTVWKGGGLVSNNFNGVPYGNIGWPSQGFRLSSDAAGSYNDPNIYGAYMRGGTVEGAVIKGGLLTGTSLLVNNMVVQSEYSSIHYGKIMHYESKDNQITVYQNRYHNVNNYSNLPRFILQAEYDALPADTKSYYTATKGIILSGGAFGPGSYDSVTVGLRANRVTSASSNIQCIFSGYISSGNTSGTTFRLHVNNSVVFTASEYNWSGSNYLVNFTAEFRGSVLNPNKENIVIVERMYYDGSVESGATSYSYFAPSAIIYNM